MEKIAIRKIEKEDLRNISFQKEEVLLDHAQVQSRWRELNRGMALGNHHKVQTLLRIESLDGEIMELQAAIWSVTSRHVILKGEILIPICCIHEVRL